MSYKIKQQNEITNERSYFNSKVIRMNNYDFCSLFVCMSARIFLVQHDFKLHLQMREKEITRGVACLNQKEID